MSGDILTLEDDRQEGEPLIQPFMRAGKRVVATEPLADLRKRALAQIAKLPKSRRTLEHAPEYPVVVSEAIRNLAREVDAAQLQSETQETAAANKSF
jgi:nicotinate phosphoribosyltransferase